MHPTLAIKRIDHLEIAVVELAAARGRYEDLGLCPTWQSGRELEQGSGARSLVLECRRERIVLTEPCRDSSRAARVLAGRAEALLTVGLRVRDARRAFVGLAERLGLPATPVRTAPGYADFELDSPIDSVRLRFLQRDDFAFAPGFVPVADAVCQPSAPAWSGIAPLTTDVGKLAHLAEWMNEVLEPAGA